MMRSSIRTFAFTAKSVRNKYKACYQTIHVRTEIYETISPYMYVTLPRSIYALLPTHRC